MWPKRVEQRRQFISVVRIIRILQEFACVVVRSFFLDRFIRAQGTRHFGRLREPISKNRTSRQALENQGIVGGRLPRNDLPLFLAKLIKMLFEQRGRTEAKCPARQNFILPEY